MVLTPPEKNTKNQVSTESDFKIANDANFIHFSIFPQTALYHTISLSGPISWVHRGHFQSY